MVDRFGADRSWSSPGDCITEVVQERLARG
jgi:hypothetical protein